MLLHAENLTHIKMNTNEGWICRVHRDPDIMGGTPIFIGTRVPVQNLIDSIEGGESIEEFLQGYPAVVRAHALVVFKQMPLAKQHPTKT